jgi:hypothetical protein
MTLAEPVSLPGGDMEHMREVAFATVLRACGFGSLAIFCVMIGLSFEPRAAFQAGGFLTTLMALILIFKAREALTKPYRKTEMWLYLPKEVRPPEAYAQWASSTVLRETYLTFAKWTAAIAIALWALALGFSLIEA